MAPQFFTMKRTFLVIAATFCSQILLAQSSFVTRPKGDFYIYWGYNRAVFTTSDITFKGPGYDFTLNDVVAYDRPTEFDAGVYFNPSSASIPQYVYRFGYFFKPNWSISVGVDHMKYVMPQTQTVAISGEINQPDNPYNGVYGQASAITLAPEFLTFEHTDGLNYVNFGTEYFFKLYQTADSVFEVAAFAGGGAGLMVPKSNVQLMSGERNDEFHIAGFGLHANAGVQISFWRHFFIRTQTKGGYLNMPDILTRPGNTTDRASQHFWFGMLDFALGGQWAF